MDTTQQIQDTASLALRVFTGLALELTAQLGDKGISVPQYHLLAFLASGPATMSHIAAHMRHTTAAATGLVDRLEKGEYLERQHDAGDRRKIIVSIKPAGVDVLQRVRLAVIEMLHAKVFARMDPRDVTAFSQLVEKITTPDIEV